MAVETVEAPYPCNVLKAFTQMGLHSSRVFGLRQNLQELIIRQEVESKKENVHKPIHK